MADFERWFSRLTAKMERFLFNFVLILLFLLVVSQALLTNSTIRTYLSKVDQLEGVPIYAEHEQREEEAVQAASIPERDYYLYLKAKHVVEGADLKVTLNGETAAALAEEQVKLKVNPGDLIEISGTVSGSQPVKVIVQDTIGLESPSPGEVIYTFGEQDLVGWAIPE